MLTKGEKLFRKELATRIKNERISRGISRDELASDVNLSPKELEEFETNNSDIGIIHLLSIITLLEIDISEVEEFYNYHLQEELEERIKKLGDRWPGNKQF